MTCWTGSEMARVSTQAGRRFFLRSSCDWTEPACVRPGGVETPAQHAGRTDGEERLVFYTASPECWCCTDAEWALTGAVRRSQLRSPLRQGSRGIVATQGLPEPPRGPANVKSYGPVSPTVDPFPCSTCVSRDEQESLQSDCSSRRLGHSPRQARHRIRSA